MNLLWVTRGYRWGFKFMDDGGLEDPLPTFEEAFAKVASTTEIYEPIGSRAVLRFLDPEGRRDGAGRPIRHEFVLFKPLADQVSSLEEARSLVWPLVRDKYAEAWDGPGEATGHA